MSVTQGKVVSPGDVNKLVEQLNDIAASWELFLGQLEVPRTVQEQISLKRTNHPRYAQICLLDGLQHWVTSDPLPTIEKVITALSSKVINNKVLALKIEQNWATLEEPTKDQTELVLQPTAHANPGSTRKGAFAGYSEEDLQARLEDDSKVQRDTEVDLEAQFKQTVKSKVLEEPAKERTDCTRTSQPAAKPGGHTLLYDKSQAENKRIQLKKGFISLVRHLKNHLKETVTDAHLPDFREEFILELPLSVKDENEKFFDRKSVEISEAKTFDVLFAYLNNHWNYLSYSLLGGIIKAYGTGDLQHILEKFAKDVKEFQKMTTLEVFWEIEPPQAITPPPGFELFVSKHSITSASTLDDLEKIRHDFCEKFDLHELAFHLVRIFKGSVVITWLVPHSVAKLVELEITQELMMELCIEDIIYANDSNNQEVRSNVQAVAGALKWYDREFQGEKQYGVYYASGTDVLLISSTEVKQPEAVAHTPPPQLTRDEIAGYLISQGVPPDYPLDDLKIMKARFELDSITEIAGVEQSTFEHRLTTSIVKSKIKELFKKSKKGAVTLYYHGPGRKGTGDWCFADGFITFQDITDLYMECSVRFILGLHVDCSYSGSWVKSLAEFLDKQGVQPCGHSARDKKIFIILDASCRANEVAQSLFYSTRMIQNDKNTKQIYSKWSNADDPQHFVRLDSSFICCDNKTIDLPCTLPPDYTWQKKQASDEARMRVNLVLDKDRAGRPVWHYVLLPDDEEVKKAFLAKAATGTIDVGDYGKILKSGWGEDPPKDIKEWAEKQDFTKYT